MDSVLYKNALQWSLCYIRPRCNGVCVIMESVLYRTAL